MRRLAKQALCPCSAKRSEDVCVQRARAAKRNKQREKREQAQRDALAAAQAALTDPAAAVGPRSGSLAGAAVQVHRTMATLESPPLHTLMKVMFVFMLLLTVGDSVAV